MSELRGFHDQHGAEYVELGGRSVVAHYGRPARAHLAVRNGVGVFERPFDIVIVTGEDRIEYVDNVVSNALPTTEGEGCYAFLLEPNGRIRLDLYIYVAEDRLLLFVPPGEGPDLLEEWRERIFIQDVTLTLATEDYTVLTVTGPQATEKLASVTNVGVPEEPFQFVHAQLEDAGVTVVPTDALTGEESYDVVCASYDAEVVLDTLVSRGLNAVPFGYEAWRTLTLEAGTPLFETELDGELPNVTGVRHALDFEKGCYVGQEVVSRVENRGQPNERLIGLTGDPALLDETTLCDAAGEEIGRITRAAESPSREAPIALAYAPYEYDGELALPGRDEVSREPLPFVEGSSQSLRIPTYPD